jgi:hypothetical protein
VKESKKVDVGSMVKDIRLLEARFEWLNNLYVSMKVSHSWVPDYPGDDFVLKELMEKRFKENETGQ